MRGWVPGLSIYCARRRVGGAAVMPASLRASELAHSVMAGGVHQPDGLLGATASRSAAVT